MKKLIFVFMASMSLLACTGNKTVEDNNSAEVTDTLVDTTLVDSIAQISE